ncbi:hypothetical protein WA1_46200 [Scytonema hofmannii PCC 7110]|uniref:Uncharacterized protein n=2 Tax=Scytonema hofmannii TaxID=34078 RepID=A0A139WYN0_9CYAN|nr:hypothetical protein WA1_46200 [Scytonema hofmannii PCC 7110]
MSHVNYEAMSDTELRQYFMSHCEDRVAMDIYLDRLSKRSRKIITTSDDPEFDAKIQAAILQQLQAKKSKSDMC